MHSSPSRIDVIGNTLALQWSNGEESFIDAPLLRTHSPSSENKGETDIFGQVSGCQVKTEYPNIKIIKVSIYYKLLPFPLFRIIIIVL